ncbi:MAG: TIR domain-containing protein [Firmicutes bacterium]|nr:TIR domain-containing protein [Bacillota bacterium]
MGHKCFISCKKEDNGYKKHLLTIFNKIDVVDKTLDRWIDSEDGDYIMGVIRDEYLYDSTVTIFLIGEYSSEKEGYDYEGNDHQYFIRKELQASFYNREHKKRSGVLGVVLPQIYSQVYKGQYTCSTCGATHNHVSINDNTVIKEFSANYYIQPHTGCSWSDDDRYCVLVKWDDFLVDPERYIDLAFEKRNHPIANRTRVYIK